MQDDSPPSLTAKRLPILALITAAACLVLMAVRMSSVFSFTEPMHVVTSGWEQENLMAMWAYMNDQPIYVSRFDIPYRWAIYNWLFYVGFATVAGAVTEALSLSDQWLPTVARLVTVVALPVGIFGTMRAYTLLIGPAKGRLGWLYGASAVLLIAGPLMGFWGMTARPDPWAMVLEIWGVVIFWSLYGKQPLRAVLVFCVFAYFAWALKQSNVGALGGVGLFLLYKRQWQLLAVLTGIMVSAWGVTLSMGSDIYLKSLTLSEFQTQNLPGAGGQSVWTLAHAADVIGKFMVKTLPFVFGAAITVGALSASSAFWEKIKADEGLALTACGVLATLAIAVPTSFQMGSADHYFFTASFFLSALALWGLRQSPTGWFSHGATAAWGLQALAIGAVLFGIKGVLSVAPTHQNLTEAKRCTDKLSRPLYAADPYLSLPWMTPGTPSFVLAYGYVQDRAAGREFESGGIGGLIEKGYFKALILSPQLSDRFDGGSLALYRLTGKPCGTYRVYLKVGDSGQ